VWEEVEGVVHRCFEGYYVRCLPPLPPRLHQGENLSYRGRKRIGVSPSENVAMAGPPRVRVWAQAQVGLEVAGEPEPDEERALHLAGLTSWICERG